MRNGENIRTCAWLTVASFALCVMAYRVMVAGICLETNWGCWDKPHSYTLDVCVALFVILVAHIWGPE